MHKCNDNCHPECCPKKLCLKQVYQPTCLTNLTIADYETPIVVIDTPTIDFTASSVNNHTITADVKVSEVSGNAIEVKPDGLYSPLFVETPETPLVATDTTTINFTTSGTAGHALTGAVNISSTAGNILTSNGTGLYVPNQIALGLVEYADNAAAVTAGLTVGSLYRTGDVLKIVHA